MKLMKNIYFIVFFAAALYFVTCFFSGYSFAEQNKPKGCIPSCRYDKKVCLNLNPDTRLCESVFQECIAKCKQPAEESSSEKTSADEKKPKKEDILK